MSGPVWEFRVEDWPGVVGGFVGRVKPARGRDLIACPKYVAALRQMGLPEGPVVEAQQVHGSRVAMVGTAELGSGRPRAARVQHVDGLLTDRLGVVLAIYVADCLAIFLHHRTWPGVGVGHAGWRGLAADLPGAMVRTALSVWGGSGGDLSCALSPCIEVCCFEVGEEVVEIFADVPGAVDHSRPRPHVDLRQVARARLQAAGVPGEQIRDLPGCTRCQPQRFASYRWDPQRCGRNLALVALSPVAAGLVCGLGGDGA